MREKLKSFSATGEATVVSHTTARLRKQKAFRTLVRESQRQFVQVETRMSVNVVRKTEVHQWAEDGGKERNCWPMQAAHDGRTAGLCLSGVVDNW